MPSGLWVIATPIGNLADLSPRASAALESANVILCEDTRRTAQLLAGAGITAPGRKGARLERLDAHATPERVEGFVSRLLAGDSIALVTDGGTPGVSDPGAALVARAREAGIRVTPFPGPSAVTALLSVAGFAETSFAFHGFFPRKKEEALRAIREEPAMGGARIRIWFESPKRIVETLGLLALEAPTAEVVAAKELTKIHERIFSGTSKHVRHAIEEEVEREGEIGEWCFAVRMSPVSSIDETESSDWVKAIQCLIEARVPASEAARQVSQHFGTPKNQAYDAALRISGKKK